MWALCTWVTVQLLTHWGQVTQICVSKLTTIGSDNGLSPGRRQAVIWTNAGILLSRPLETNFSDFFASILQPRLLTRLSKVWVPKCLGDLCTTVLNMLKISWRPWRPLVGLNVICPTSERLLQPFALLCTSNGDLVSFLFVRGRHAVPYEYWSTLTRLEGLVCWDKQIKFTRNR